MLLLTSGLLSIGNVRSIQAVSMLFTPSERIRGARITQIRCYTSTVASATAIISGIRKMILLLMHKPPGDTMRSRALQGLGNGCRTILSQPRSSSRVTLERIFALKLLLNSATLARANGSFMLQSTERFPPRCAACSGISRGVSDYAQNTKRLCAGTLAQQ